MHETGAVDDGIISRIVNVPKEDYELIYSGPHFYVGNPLYKTPRQNCVLNSDYDNISLSSIEEDYCQRSNYLRKMPLPQYCGLYKGFMCEQSNDGKPVFENWLGN